MQYREYSPVVADGRRQAELDEDVGHVLLDRAVGQHQSLGAGGRGIWGHLGARIGDGRTLREIAYVVLNLPLGFLLTFASIYPWVQTVYSLSYPFVHWNDHFSVHAWGGPSWSGAVSVHTLPGLLTLLLGPWLIRGVTWLHGKFVQVMLGP